MGGISCRRFVDQRGGLFDSELIIHDKGWSIIEC